MSVSAGGSTQTDTLIALAIVGVWIVAGAVWLVLNSAATKTSLLVKPQRRKSGTASDTYDRQQVETAPIADGPPSAAARARSLAVSKMRRHSPHVIPH